MTKDDELKTLKETRKNLEQQLQNVNERLDDTKVQELFKFAIKVKPDCDHCRVDKCMLHIKTEKDTCERWWCLRKRRFGHGTISTAADQRRYKSCKQHATPEYVDLKEIKTIIECGKNH